MGSAVTSQGLGTLIDPAGPRIDRNSGWEQGSDVSSSSYSGSSNVGDSVSSASLACAAAGGYSVSGHASDRVSGCLSAAQVAPADCGNSEDSAAASMQEGGASVTSHSGVEASSHVGQQPHQLPHQHLPAGGLFSTREDASYRSSGGSGEQGGWWSMAGVTSEVSSGGGSIAGLQPVNFVSLASPHLGSRSSGNVSECYVASV